MSWGSAGFPSPMMRRTSRPLSMICENPDDSNHDRKVKVIPVTNGTAQTQIEVENGPKATINKSRGAPTRRKAVAPLQHPVTVLLDKQPDSINSNKHSTSSNENINEKKIHIPETTPTVSSIIKRFSSMNNEKNADGNTTTESAHNQRFTKISPSQNTTATSKHSSSDDSGIVSDILNSPEIIDINHNKMSWKSANGSDSNPINTISNPEIAHNSSTKKAKSNVCSEQNNCFFKIQFHSSVKKEDSINSQSNEECDSKALQTTSVQDTKMTLCGEHSYENGHRIIDSPKEDTCDLCNIENTNNADGNQIVFNSCRSPNNSSNNNTQGKSITSHNNNVCSTPKDTCPPDCKEFRDSNATQSPKSAKSFTSEGDDSVFNYSHDSQDSSDHANDQTSTLNFKATATVTLTSNVQTHLLKTSPARSIKTTLPTFEHDPQQNTTTHQLPQTKNGMESLKVGNKNIIITEIKDSRNNEQPAENQISTLDGETLEWKKRVKRSVSLIKSPSISDNSGPKPRRISSGQTSYQNSEIKVHEHPPANRITHDNNNNAKQIKDDGVKSQSNQSTGPIRRISAIDQSDFSLLKVATSRLNLPTRRPSVTAWKEKYLNKNKDAFNSPSSSESEEIRGKPCSGIPDKSQVCQDTNSLDIIIADTKGKLEITDEEKNRINSNLAWLRQELIDIRILDQALARQLLNLREAMNEFRLAVECEGHQELILDAEEDMEEIRQLSQLVDIPPEMLSPLSPLKHVGITRMNISSRRFSTC